MPAKKSSMNRNPHSKSQIAFWVKIPEIKSNSKQMGSKERWDQRGLMFLEDKSSE